MSFDLDLKRLSETLNAISICKAKPNVDIKFTVKDDSGVKEEVLRNATINARRKADILALSSGVKIEKIVNIEYSWQDIELYSDTKYIEAMPLSKMANID